MADLHEIKQLCDEFTHDMAQAAPQRDWAAWLAYSLEALEDISLSTDPDPPIGFETVVLRKLQESIAARLKAGRW